MPTFHNILQTQIYLQPLQKSGNTSEEHAQFSSEATHKPKTFTEVFHVPPFYIKQDQAYFFFSAIPVYCIPDPGENLQKTLLIA